MTPIKGKPRGKGKPFTKGDPRIARPKQGPLCTEAWTFGVNFKNALAKGGDPKELADVLWTAAKRARPWAVELILAYLIGKPEQPISAEVKGQVVFMMPRPGKD